MSAQPDQHEEQHQDQREGRPAGQPSAGRRPRRRTAKRVVLVVVAAAIVAVGALAATGAFKRGGTAGAGAIGNGSATGLATVTRQNLSAQTDENATLGYAKSYNVIDQAQGTFTALPSVGQVIRPGQVLYQVNGSPVVLLRGSTPAYRTLSEGAYASDVTGADVAELNADLVALGYATTAEIPAGSDEFTWQTTQAVERLQAHLGVEQTGTLTLGQAVFLPTAVRVTAVSATAGTAAQPGQAALTGTSTTRDVTVPLDAAQQAQVKVGDKVIITLPNNQTTPGVVSAVGKVASAPQGSGTPIITVYVTPTDPAVTGSLDQAPVEVAITTASVRDTLVVPVDALLALAGGGYAVEVAGAGGAHHLVPVSLGLFDDADGLVQVTGPGLAAGEQTGVPAL
jgi:Putative peptidoglycan binding domain